MQTKVDHILKTHQLSVTESRKHILELFKLSNGALAHADIEKQTGDQFDRVTIYRTLQTFVEKGIIHTILPIILFATPFVGMNAAKAIIKTIIFILFVTIAVLLFV